MTKKMNKKITSSTLTKVARLILVLALIVVQATANVSPALAAETNDLSVTVDGVKYTPQINNGQAQLLIGDKVIYLSSPNIMAYEFVDQYGTAWTISYSGRCAGYNYNLQKNETSVNLHEFTLKAEEPIFSGKYGVAIKKTTGEIVNLPNLEEFKRLAGYTSNNTPNVPSVPSVPNVPTGNTTVITNLVKTMTVNNKQYTFIVNNGIAKVIVGNNVITIPDINICDISVDDIGTIIFENIMNGIKYVRWYNPELQKEVKTNVLTLNDYCLIKDSKGVVTGVNMYYSHMKLLTLEEQKKVLGITTETSKTTQNMARVVPKGTYTYVVYDKNNKEQYTYTFKNGTLTFKKGALKGKKFTNIARAGVLNSNNMALTTKKGSITSLNYKTGKKKLLYSYADCGKSKEDGYDSTGHIIKATTVDNTEIDLTKF